MYSFIFCSLLTLTDPNVLLNVTGLINEYLQDIPQRRLCKKIIVTACNVWATVAWHPRAALICTNSIAQSIGLGLNTTSFDFPLYLVTAIRGIFNNQPTIYLKKSPSFWGTRTFGAKRVWKVSTCSPTSVSLERHPLTIQLDHSALRSSPHGPGDHKEPLTLRRSPRRYLQTWRTYVKNHQAFGPTNHEHAHTNYWSLDDNLTLDFHGTSQDGLRLAQSGANWIQSLALDSSCLICTLSHTRFVTRLCYQNTSNNRIWLACFHK